MVQSYRIPTTQGVVIRVFCNFYHFILQKLQNKIKNGKEIK